MLILQTLQWGPQHGYAISQAKRIKSGEVLQVETGSLYPALHRLERQGWVRSEWKQAESRQRAKFCRITAAGKKQLAADHGRWETMVQAIAWHDAADPRGRQTMRRWRSIFRKHSSDLDDEIQFHIAMAIRDRIERGESPETAHKAVMREFGNLALVKDVMHEMWGRGWFDRLAQDLGFALRQLRKSPGFTVTVVMTVALAIGANTAIFSLSYALLLRSLPIPHPDQLVQIELHSLRPEPNPYLTSALYGAVKDQQRVFSGVCAWQGYLFTGEQNSDGREIGATMVRVTASQRSACGP
jgi:transcriptional regulator